jgi:UDP-N-acetylglucosamine 4,6-dehydratase/5-epimerase
LLTNLDTRARAAVEGRSILITGAAGTIGRLLAKRLLDFNPAVLRLLDHDEERTFYLQAELREREQIRVLLGDIRDRARMTRAIQGIDYVFHAAALKHVGLGEYNPFEVVHSNLMALQGLIECAIDANVEKFVFTSSDKAVNPTNVMGGCKFVGERLVAAGNLFRGRARTIFCSTRFGNVLGSSGSAVALFKRQIEAGLALTVTERDMTRFFMTADEAVDLLLAALLASRGGEIFVPKMHAMQLGDLIDALGELLAPQRKLRLEKIGRRAGEKPYEELISEHEVSRCLETDRLLIILPFLGEDPLGANGIPTQEQLGPYSYPDSPKWATKAFNSHAVTPLSKAAILEMLGGELAKDRF